MVFTFVQTVTLRSTGFSVLIAMRTILIVPAFTVKFPTFAVFYVGGIFHLWSITDLKNANEKV